MYIYIYIYIYTNIYIYIYIHIGRERERKRDPPLAPPGRAPPCCSPSLPRPPDTTIITIITSSSSSIIIVSSSSSSSSMHFRAKGNTLCSASRDVFLTDRKGTGTQDGLSLMKCVAWLRHLKMWRVRHSSAPDAWSLSLPNSWKAVWTTQALGGSKGRRSTKSTVIFRLWFCTWVICQLMDLSKRLLSDDEMPPPIQWRPAPYYVSWRIWEKHYCMIMIYIYIYIYIYIHIYISLLLLLLLLYIYIYIYIYIHENKHHNLFVINKRPPPIQRRRAP